MSNQCGTCRHWKPFDGKENHSIEGFGTCGKARMYDSYETKKAKDNWLFCVMDGSDYFAALKTRETFGCNQWEGMNEAIVIAKRLGMM